MANYVSQVIGDEGCDEKRPGNGVLVLMWNRDDIGISLVDKKALINGEEVGGAQRRAREFDEEDEGGHWAYESLFPSLPPHKIFSLCAPLYPSFPPVSPSVPLPIFPSSKFPAASQRIVHLASVFPISHAHYPEQREFIPLAIPYCRRRRQRDPANAVQSPSHQRQCGILNRLNKQTLYILLMVNAQLNGLTQKHFLSR